MPTLNELESGIDSSQPLELYKFLIDPEKFTYTSADIDITYNSEMFRRAAITRGVLAGTSDPDKGTITLTVPYTLPIVQQILTVPPSLPINLTIFRGQRGSPGLFLQSWVGRIVGHEVVGNEVTLRGISLLSNQYRMGNSLRFQKACPYALYDTYNCKVNPLSHRYTCNPTLTTASKVTSASLVWSAAGIPTALKEGWFLGGYVEYADNYSKVVGKRSIIDYDHAAGVVTVFPPLRGFTSGAEMHFHPGCAHNTKSCHEKFGNIPNYGGDPLIPDDDPFDPTTEVF